MKPTLLILAAGIGSRYGSLKQLDPIGPSGETIIDYSVFDAAKAGFGKVVFVIRESIEKEFKDYFSERFPESIKVEYVFQEIDKLPQGFNVPEGRTKPWGTAHAVLMAAEVIKEPFVVINADDFYGYESFKIVADFLSLPKNNSTPEFCMAGYLLKNTLSDFGSVSRGICVTDEYGNLKSVTEVTNIEKSEKGIGCFDSDNNWNTFTGEEIVSMNFWGFTPEIFEYINGYFVEFIKENHDNPKAEFYIPLVVTKLIESGIVETKVLKSEAKWFGVTYKEDKQNAVKKLLELIKKGNYPKNL